MGKSISIGANNVARKGKAVFIGVDNVARKVKKAWIGDENGVAREFFSSAEPFYWIQDGVVQDGFPSDYGTYSLTPSGAFEYRIGLTDAHVYGHSQNSNTQFTGETVAVSTKGNRYMEVVIASVDNRGILNSFLVAGKECKDQVSNGAIITVDVSSMSEVTIKLVMTAYAWGNHMGLSIKSIRFYS